MTIQDFDIQVASAQHVDYAPIICDEMAESAKARGTGIAQRTPEYVADKMLEGKAVIALYKDDTCADFLSIIGDSSCLANPFGTHRKGIGIVF